MSSVTDEIKARVDLVELIGRTVALKRIGAYYRGLCPFHSEKTPSFYVRPQTQSWHCFGCNKSGTAFDWLMEREHLDFGEALRSLATLTGVALPERRNPETEDQSRRLYSILERAQTYYAGLLWGTSGARARDYLYGRGLNEETLRLFGVGYAASGNGLLRYLEKDGFSDQELQAAGVIGITEDEGRQYDFFRERVLFPIRDVQGGTIAFGGRALDDASTPKYLNSRDTLLFHKQETLFAFDLARKPIAHERQAVIVEGYMDAAMAHQHGYHTVVATLGTALTDRHLRLLRRHVDEIRLALDPDTAGRAATWRALQTADQSLQSGVIPVVGPTRRQQHLVPDRPVRLLVMELPDGKDPDELIRSDPAAWPRLVQGAMPVIDFVLERLEARHDLKTAQGKRSAADEMLDVLTAISDPIEQDHYVNEVANLLNAKPDVIRGLLRGRGKYRRVAPPTEPAVPQVAAVQGDAQDDYLLALVMRLQTVPEAVLQVAKDLEFILPESRALYKALGGEIPPELEPYAERARRKLPDVERLSTRELVEEIERKRLEIRGRLLEAQRLQLSRLLKEGGLDREEAARLLDQCRRELGDVDQQLSPERESAGTR